MGMLQLLDWSVKCKKVVVVVIISTAKLFILLKPLIVITVNDILLISD